MTHRDTFSAADAGSLPSPVRRNFPWLPLQILTQSLAPFWFRYRARGLQHLPATTGALLLINHRGFVDPIFAGLAIRRPVSFVARHNLFSVPVLGGLMRRTYVVPINRDTAATASLRSIIARLEHGFLVGLFPEGTRHRGPEAIGRLKPGFVSVLRRVNVPVIPVGIAGADAVMPRSAVFIRPAPVRVVFGERIPADRLSECTSRGREAALLNLVARHLSAAVTEAHEWLARSGQH